MRFDHSILADVISTVEVKGSEKRHVAMDTPNRKIPLMTKCEMYDKDNNCVVYSSELMV